MASLVELDQRQIKWVIGAIWSFGKALKKRLANIERRLKALEER